MNEENKMIFCTECGSENPGTSKFCSNCGSKLEMPAENPMQPVYEKVEAEIMEESTAAAIPDPAPAPAAESAAFVGNASEAQNTDSFWSSSSGTEKTDSFWNSSSEIKTEKKDSFWNSTSETGKTDSFWDSTPKTEQSASSWGSSEIKKEIPNQEINIQYDAEENTVPPVYQSPQPQYYSTNQSASAGNAGSGGYVGISVASMVCGILSLLCCCFTFFSMLLGIAALALGIGSVKNGYDGRGMAIAGMICGGIGTFIALIFLILGGFSDFFTDRIDELLSY